MDLPPLTEDLSLPYRLREAHGAAAGLVLLMHGVGSNESSLAGLAALLPDDVAVALVRSPLEMAPGSYSAFTVEFTANGPVIDAAAAEDSRRRLQRFAGELQARTGIAPARTLAAGFSQGGIMAAGLALTCPQTVAGFAILSGRILPEIAPLIAPPEALAGLEALIAHGEQDDRLPVAWAQRSAELLRRLGVRFEERRYAARHEITRDMADDFAAWVRRLLAPRG
ncbi:alpha/beta hydrolase [Thauera sinica]|uniref:Alpha/beta hydrolase n=1 Tax=Thauera sinica TaxID=2665146 RepID=A0ABW1AS81_9RHOO|nr:phospholipase [Thauera sp. K11]ATE61127.1 phospholipase [Thauera sp. K11]